MGMFLDFMLELAESSAPSAQLLAAHMPQLVRISSESRPEEVMRGARCRLRGELPDLSDPQESGRGFLAGWLLEDARMQARGLTQSQYPGEELQRACALAEQMEQELLRAGIDPVEVNAFTPVQEAYWVLVQRMLKQVLE